MTKPDDVVVVCMPTAFGNPMGFDDSVYGKCDVCGVPIHWRPHNPPGRHICIVCLPGQIPAGEGVQAVATGKTLMEVVAYIESKDWKDKQ